MYACGLRFANQVQNEIEWWIFWGRVAGGLKRINRRMYSSEFTDAAAARVERPPRVNPSLLREMWRAAASLEHLPVRNEDATGRRTARAILKNDFVERACGASRDWARGSCSTGRSIKWFLQRRRRAGWKALVKVPQGWQDERCRGGHREAHGRRHARIFLLTRSNWCARVSPRST